eukprot:CAMPEP_0194754930 /NCGR_PEP_ID=MMETSP0323_2-20130528/8855_1 /TAXON_ID=2866 ORGANISM="Crypthecodinium cohnii, Strain Seligo" /NCGR_SAMPLE_ID=MMETSP0323_2 /ASSEMBLY_ACC=CAM_ASM_000346 /LENGTH=109 /DNA_ID=CAMNT_0039673729 /DNA_START=415 /DNA_END=741 /DNA_ORIENTATION=-
MHAHISMQKRQQRPQLLRGCSTASRTQAKLCQQQRIRLGKAEEKTTEPAETGQARLVLLGKAKKNREQQKTDKKQKKMKTRRKRRPRKFTSQKGQWKNTKKKKKKKKKK